jgi:hypothetical protein
METLTPLIRAAVDAAGACDFETHNRSDDSVPVEISQAVDALYWCARWLDMALRTHEHEVARVAAVEAACDAKERRNACADQAEDARYMARRLAGGES